MRRATGRVSLALIVFLCLDVAMAQQLGPIAGPNVNVIAGTGPGGDWTMQRQNEPTIACSSRNPAHCMAGANDYRTVDIPFPTIGERLTGDAWQGWYTTKDGGQTWRSGLLPGYPQDTSAAGLASPLRGYPAGADPVIRAGTNGLFYYAGLVFDREEDGGSAIFVARFIDNNNQEGTAGDPIAYIDASIVHRMGLPPSVVAARRERERNGRAGRAVAERRPARDEDRDRGRGTRARAGVEQQAAEQLVDKPWIAVDIPRTGAQTCSIGGGTTGIPAQSFPGGRVYVVYTIFDGPGEQRGRIMFSTSGDCGRTWTAGRLISRVQSADVNDDGVANTADVTRVQAAYNRTCGQTGYNANADVNNDCRVDLVDLTLVSRGVGQPVPRQPRLSQGGTLAIDPVTGAVQIAWRQFNDGVLGDAIVTVRATNNGSTISAPRVVAPVVPYDQGDSNTSFRTNGLPTIAMDGTGRAYLAWSARGYAGQRPLPEEDDARVVISTSTNGTAWSAPQQVDSAASPGHQIMPALTFAQGKLQLLYYDLREDESQLFQRFVDELPILTGAPPRIRHTMDVRAGQSDPGPTPTFETIRVTQYRFGAVPGLPGVQQLEFNPPNLPIFRAGTTPFMGDYIDVAPEIPFVRTGSSWAFNTAPSTTPAFHGVWTDNRDIRPPANGVWTDYTPPNPPFARPTTSLFDPTQSIPACVPGQAGMRNQNIYTSRITRGLVVGAVGNSRRLSPVVQRTFPVYAQNNSTQIRSYRLTINNQPVGGQASFKQFEMLTTLDVQVPRRSTVARTVFVRSSDPHAQVAVSVVEITAPAGTVIPNGQSGTIVLNPDPTNPDLENPDLENPDLENPDLENQEVHNPDLENATVRNPDLENPDLENPDLENPDLENARVANPSILNPDLENPDLENPDLENPDLENPDLENANLISGALSDTTWTVTNKGNTAASFTIKLALNRQMPAGFISQLIAHKIYQTPTVLGCSLLKQTQTVLLANIPNPRFVTAGQIANPDLENPDLENLTVALAPGETARITVRMFDPDRSDAITFRAADSVTPVAVAQAVSTAEAQSGVTQPQVAAVLTPNAPVPGTTVGGTYTTSLPSTVPGTWTIAGGDLPPGVTLNEDTGVITGTPTAPGTYTFTARFQSTTGLNDYRTMTITVGGAGAAADAAVSATGVFETAGNILYSIVASNAGPAAATNVVITDTLPEGTVFVSATPGQGSCTHANGTVQCTLGSIPSGGAVSIQLRVRPRAAGAHVNHVSIAATDADPNTANNAVDTTLTTGPVTPCTTVCFSGPTSFIAGPLAREFGGISADFNNDGNADLAFGPIADNTVGIMLSNGTGGFGPATSRVLPGSPDAGEFGDFNNDGNVDIVIGSDDAAQAWLLLGDGAGGFGPTITIPLPAEAQNLAVADFNRDGNDDLAVTNGDAGTAVWILHGNGNATFQPAVTVGTVNSESSLVTDDFNRDGNPDLAVHITNTVVIILGNGASGFQPPVSIAVPGVTGVLKVGDLTGDGFPDLLVGTPDAIALLVNNGSGGFAAPVATSIPNELVNESLAVSDFDSDGDRDFVWSRVGGGIGIQLNDGTGTFAAPFFISSPANQVVVGDFNGDRRPDIAALAGGTLGLQSQVLIYLNTCDRPPADLAITLQGPAVNPTEGADFSYQVQITNNGPNPATGAVFDFAFAPSASFVSISGVPGSCSVERTHITCPLGTIAAGAGSAITVVVRPLAGFVIGSHAGVTATTSDPNPANNAAFLQTPVTAGVSTIVVTNTNDSGPGSLAHALFLASDPGPRDTIVFNIPGSGPHTIEPTQDSPLGNILQPVVIDGTTQPGYAGTPLIEINGARAGGVNGLLIVAPNTIVRGLAINRFSGAGISLQNSGATGIVIESNMLGTDPTGTIARPNGLSGIFVGSPNTTIGGVQPGTRNVISGNLLEGVFISGGASGTILLNNLIGTNAAGTDPLGNNGSGVFVQSNNNRVGSTETGLGNTIAFNGSSGVGLSVGTGNEVVNNRIFSNGGLGIDIAPAGVTPNDPGDTDTGPNNRINFPNLTSATRANDIVRVRGTLSPSPAAPFFVHFYASQTCDP
ncbi:MAG TPA: FG-GAP-like repeat-containing protein, partial [Vicinamibacterales bacterium]